MGATAKDGAPVQWTLVIPLKPLARAKSRLAAAAGDGLRPGLALAFAQDTVAAALACPAVRDVAVVTDDALARPRAGGAGRPDRAGHPGGGLNAALAHGAGRCAPARPRRAVAALNADLPALRPAELARVLDGAAAIPRAFLRMRPESARRCCPPRPGTELRPGVRHGRPGPGTGLRGGGTRRSPEWIPCARTWTPATTCGRRSRSAWVRAPRAPRPGWLHPPTE